MGIMPPKKAKFDDDSAIPDFLWDRGTTVGELRAILADAEHLQRIPLLRTLLREARPDEVWSFVSPDLVVREWEDIKPGLGKRLAFWTWLLGAWRDRGFLK